MSVPADRRPIGYWLKLLDRLIDERLDASLGNLSRRHWQVMNVIHQGPVSQAEIDARLRLADRRWIRLAEHARPSRVMGT